MDSSTLEMVDENSDLWGPANIQDVARAAGEVREDEDDIPYVSDGEDSEEEGEIST
jgi:hypothetical protein